MVIILSLFYILLYYRFVTVYGEFMAEKKILIVEDELAIREMMKFAFQKNHFIFLEAEDAEQAQAIILDNRPDLILLDWMLPGMSGLDLARQLKKNTNYNGFC